MQFRVLFIITWLFLYLHLMENFSTAIRSDTFAATIKILVLVDIRVGVLVLIYGLSFLNILKVSLQRFLHAPFILQLLYAEKDS